MSAAPVGAERSAWTALAGRLNPAYARPRLCEGLVARQLTSARGEPYYILKNPRAGTYVRLAPDEYYLLSLMDGQHQVAELVQAYVERYQRFAFHRVAALVSQLRQHHFLVEVPHDVWNDLARRLAAGRWTHRADRLLRGFFYHEFPIQGLDAPMVALYCRVGWLFFTRPALVLLVASAAFGVAAFVWELARGQHDPLRLGGSYAAGLVVLLVLWAVMITIHELGHAMATRHYGREVRRGGVMLYFGMPAFFVDTTDIWLEPQRPRLVVGAAGMAIIWGLGGLAMLCVLVVPGTPLASLAFQLAFIAFVSNSLQLMPLLELDGYYMLVDWLEMPLLRGRAFAFVRGDLWRKLRARQPFEREERIYAVYGVLGIAYSGFAIWAAVYFWVHRLQHLAADVLQSESLLARGLVALLMVAIGVPFAVGLAVRAGHGLGRVRREWWLLSHQPPTGRAQTHREAPGGLGALRFLWRLAHSRHEAIARDLGQRERWLADREALAGASLFQDLDATALDALLAHLQTEEYPAGATVVQQGEPATRFYVVRQGRLQVTSHDAGGREQGLTELADGEHFGEVALLADTTWTVTVRTLTAATLWSLDAASFHELLLERYRLRGPLGSAARERNATRRRLAAARAA